MQKRYFPKTIVKWTLGYHIEVGERTENRIKESTLIKERFSKTTQWIELRLTIRVVES